MNGQARVTTNTGLRITEKFRQESAEFKYVDHIR